MMSSAKMRRQRVRSTRGQNLIEALAGFVILIPIGLAAIDLVAFVSACESNEHLAETASRAAARAPGQAEAQASAEDAVKHCQPVWMVQHVFVDDVEYSCDKGMVSVVTIMQLKLPIPIPGTTEINCRASSIEPIVYTPAPG